MNGEAVGPWPSHYEDVRLVFRQAISSGLIMIAKQWRQRLSYTAMSVIVGWHALAMVVAAGPESSDTAKSLRSLLTPYLSLFNLDHKWNFFCADCLLRT